MRSSVRLVASALMLCAATGLLPQATMAKSIRVTGLVVDYRAQPVEGATVVLCGEPPQRFLGGQALVELGRTKSSSEGRFTISLDRQGEFSASALIAHAQGLALCWTTQNLDTRCVILRLGRAKPLGGVVVDEAGQPVAEARVSLCVKNEMMELGEIPMPGLEDWHTRQTDKDGRFLFDNLPADTTADFRIEAPGRARIWTFRDRAGSEGKQFPVGRTDLRLMLPPEERVEGTVVDEDTGKPVSGLCVLARPDQRAGATYYSEPAPVDPNGRFVLAGLAAGTYRLEVVAPRGQVQEWFSSAPLLLVQHARPISDFKLPVHPGATLEIVTREPDSDTIAAGIQVQVGGNSFARSLTTDAKGWARLHLPPGKYTIGGGKEGNWVYLPRNVDLEKGQVEQEEMRSAVKAVHVSGTALDPQGHALAGASVIHWPFWLVAPTDANGAFEYTFYTTGSGSEHTLWLRHERSGLATIVRLKDPSGSRHLAGSITLKPAYTLVGQVTDPNGIGIPAATVRLLTNQGNRSPRRVRILVELVADANGTYHLRGIAKPDPNSDGTRSDEYYALVAYAPGYNETSIDPVNLEGPVEEPVHLRTLILQPEDQAISGVVDDANEKPVPGVLVETPGLRPRGYDEHEDAVQPHRQVFTDRQGRFHIDDLCKGPVEVSAHPADASGREGITYTSAGERDVKVVLGQTLSFGKSLKDAPLPSLAGFGLREPLSDLEDKAVLLCFLDVQQRPSRHVLDALAQRGKELGERNIVLVLVQAAPCEASELDKRIAECTKDFHWGKIADDPEKAQRAWGIQSLPWLILADRHHTIRAEGFPPAALEERLSSLR